jgi:phosphoribosylanthranilate isomerase
VKSKPRVNLLHRIPRRGVASIASGASALRLISSMPSGPGVIPEASIAEIAGRIPPPIATFLLTSATASEAIIAQQRRCGTNTLQLCDYAEVSVYRELRRELPGVAVVQVIHVTGPEGLDRAREAAEHVHALLLIHKRGALT